MGRESASDTQYWLAFVQDGDFARSMLASDPTERTYITGCGQAKPIYTDNTFLVTPPYPTPSGGNIGFNLGVPAPSAGMTAAVGVAGSGADETRSYVATFVRANGDESAPSDAVTIVVPGGSTVTLANLPAAPVGNHGIDKRRIYVATTDDYQEVIEVASGLASTTDNGTTRGTTLETGCSSQFPAWLEPPNDLTGIIELWGGMHGGHTGKAYRISVPYSPHAWPIEYRAWSPTPSSERPSGE